MWLMLQHPEPLDLVIATGKQYSVRDFVEEASRNLGFDIAWQGNGINEVGVDSKSGQTLIVVDERYFRPAEVETLLGDATKANTLLNWNPRTTFNELVSEMCESDLAWAKSLK
jgi:GDPmannose 4,6-dehydratase